MKHSLEEPQEMALQALGPSDCCWPYTPPFCPSISLASYAWLFTSVVLTLGRLTLDIHKLEAGLGYTVPLCLRKKKKEKGRKEEKRKEGKSLAGSFTPVLFWGLPEVFLWVYICHYILIELLELQAIMTCLMWVLGADARLRS